MYNTTITDCPQLNRPQPLSGGLGIPATMSHWRSHAISTTQGISAHVQSEVDKANNLIDHIQHIRQQVHDILDKDNAKYKQQHDQHRVSHKFQMGDKVWLHLQK